MQVDRYTKGVLTVIAAALVGILLQDALRPATAQADIVRAVLCDAKDPRRCASMTNVGNSIDPWYALPTRNVPQQ
jgi:hypothetical protein